MSHIEVVRNPAGMDGSVSWGRLHWVLYNDYGYVKLEGWSDNLITQVGDQVQAERAAGIGALAAPTGMKMGTGSTAASKTGAGAALVTYLSDSHQAFDATFPSSALVGSARRITWKTTYAAGKATTATPITEAVIVNNATLTDATSTSANTVHRALVSGVPSKGAGEVLTLIWTWDLQGT
jgi:hypothetical protein